MRDYIYISLGGNRDGRNRTLRNLMLTMALGGFWHGAAWNFLCWGLYHGALLAAARATGWLQAPTDGGYQRRAGRVALTFHLVLVGWFLFRVERLEDFALWWRSTAVETVRDWGTLQEMLVVLLVFALAHAVRYRTGLRLAAPARPRVLQALVGAAAVAAMGGFGAPAV
ncbi:MAG: MBOAT family O-acyltransferase [Candidatus Latescibacterota bacterium]|nr:MBOAT family O-acyltransferase [Candidatus Latescibacterota bacterium]